MSGVLVIFTTVVAFPAVMEIFKQRMAVLLRPWAQIEVDVPLIFFSSVCPRVHRSHPRSFLQSQIRRCVEVDLLIDDIDDD